MITAGSGESAPAPSGVVTPQQTADATNVSYADVIMSAAQSSGVNPYVIAAMIIQEQGSDGRGNSISGNYAGYIGYYNYFNVGAYASDGMGAVERGLWYASQSGTYGRPWTSPVSSIVGGAQFYGENYVSAGQSTLYLKKYNVQGSNMYKHQYMTNVDGAASEGSILAEGFTAQQKSLALNFNIPVYANMPESPCVKPTGDGSPNNKLGGLGVEGFSLTPTFNRDILSYDLIVDHSVSNVNVLATALDSKATVTGAGNIGLNEGNNDITLTVRAENGVERVYVIHVVRQAGGPTYNGAISGGVSSGGDTSVTVVEPGTHTPESAGTSTSAVITAGPGAGSGVVTPIPAADPAGGAGTGDGNVSFSPPGT